MCRPPPPRGFLRSDKPVGTAVVKLDKLETQSEIREIVEVRKGTLDTAVRWRLKKKTKTRTRVSVSGDERPQAHRRARRGQGASAGASERTGHAVEHRALAGDRSHAGEIKASFDCASTRDAQLLFFFPPLPRFSCRCCQRGSDNLKDSRQLKCKNSKSKTMYHSKGERGGSGAAPSRLARRRKVSETLTRPLPHPGGHASARHAAHPPGGDGPGTWVFTPHRVSPSPLASRRASPARRRAPT